MAWVAVTVALSVVPSISTGSPVMTAAYSTPQCIELLYGGQADLA
jgi:hypothetical protein